MDRHHKTWSALLYVQCMIQLRRRTRRGWLPLPTQIQRRIYIHSLTLSFAFLARRVFNRLHGKVDGIRNFDVSEVVLIPFGYVS